MIFIVRKIFQCLTSPRLYNVHRDGPVEMLYNPRKSEAYADLIISVAKVFGGVTYYMSPFICFYIYKRGNFTFEESHTWATFFGGLGCFLAMAFMVRAYGRARNPKYLQFLDDLNSPKDNMATYLEKMRKYDFEFHAWPASHEVPYNTDSPCFDRSRPFVSTENSHLPFYKKCAVKLLAYIAVNTFALRLIYPGTISFIQYMLWNTITQGRASLIEDNGGQRAKVMAADGNSIDTMFVDNRNKTGAKGNILVVCSEGNSGFYEIGIMNTPIKAGYSALGWNHPGFAGSTGLPYPRQEHCAIDAVMQYAIYRLKFQPDQIVMFGWSIGGYSASWAAVYYHTKALILDATFDDLVPLAVNQMPPSWETLVKEVVRAHVDLNVAEMTKHYKGPVHFIRRTDDEIICLTPGDISSNRGNHLVLKIITHRHAEEVDNLLEVLIRFVMMPAARRPKVTDPVLDATVRCMLRLIIQYTSDYQSTHCSPLPSEKFEEVLDYIIDVQKLRRD